MLNEYHMRPFRFEDPHGQEFAIYGNAIVLGHRDLESVNVVGG